MSLLLGCVAVVMAATVAAVIFAGVTKAKKKKAEATAAGTGLSQSVHDCTLGTVAATAVDDQQLQTAKPADGVKWPPHQCGLEDDADQWEKWEGPQRIKECQLSAADQERCRKMLELIFSEDVVLGKKVLFHPDDVLDICELVIPYLESEPVLIEDLPFGISIVGDLHGQLYDLHRVFIGVEKDGKPGWECAKFVFLGNYVDRGRQSLEIVMALFCIKMLHPDRIFLLRGSHEYIIVNYKYGFFADCDSRYLPDTAKHLFTMINLAFCYLSLAAIVGHKYFCVHSGISTSGFTRRQLRAVYKPILRSTDDILVHDLAYSEPATGLRGTCFNKDRKTSFYFGLDALCSALDNMNVDCIIRGSKMMTEGFSVYWHLIHTVFTATAYGGAKNDGGICEIDENGKVSYRILPYHEAHEQWMEALMKAEAADGKVPDEIKSRYDDVGSGAVVDLSTKR